MDWLISLLLLLLFLAGSASLGSVAAWTVARSEGNKDEYPWNWRLLIWPTVYFNWLDKKENTDGNE